MQAFSETFQTKAFYPKHIRKCITCERSINLTFVFEQNPDVPKVQQRHPTLENW